ncbi:unnamed protein product [Chrysoparadoxa australica]
MKSEITSVPLLYWFNKFERNGKACHMLVEEQLAGLNVQQLRDLQSPPATAAQEGQPAKPQGLHINVCVEFALSMLKCIESLHSVDFIHRDLHPSHFIQRKIGDHALCLSGFRYVKAFKTESGMVVPERTEVKEFKGNLFYSSLGALRGKDQGRGDDLISLVYLFLDLYKGSLPWSDAARAGNKQEVITLMAAALEDVWSDELSVNINVSMILKSIQALKWDQAPDYGALEKLFGGMKKDQEHPSFNWSPEAPPVPELEGEEEEEKKGTAVAEPMQMEDAPMAEAVIPPSEAKAIKEAELEAEKQQLEADLAHVNEESDLEPKERCKLWCGVAKKLVISDAARLKPPLSQLEELLEAAQAQGTFFETQGLSMTQVMKIQRLVFQTEQTVDKRRPQASLTVKGFTEGNAGKSKSKESKGSSRPSKRALEGDGSKLSPEKRSRLESIEKQE